MGRRTRKEILEERLTADQIKAVYLLLDNELRPGNERMTQEEIAAKCNTHRATLYRWRTQNQDFIDYRREVTRNYISDMSGLFLKSLRNIIDRKSTRLNSSHVAISYAVFCLRKKKTLFIIIRFTFFY